MLLNFSFFTLTIHQHNSSAHNKVAIRCLESSADIRKKLSYIYHLSQICQIMTIVGQEGNYGKVTLCETKLARRSVCSILAYFKAYNCRPFEVTADRAIKSGIFSNLYWRSLIVLRQAFIPVKWQWLMRPTCIWPINMRLAVIYNPRVNDDCNYSHPYFILICCHCIGQCEDENETQ